MFKASVIATLCLAGMAMAHGGVQNPTVMARMDAMTGIGDGMKVLGGMLKGELAFDVAAAQAALDLIEARAAEVPALFTAPESDPKSEAAPAIWDNWADFEAKALALSQASAGAITDKAGLRETVGALVGTCKGCHRDYRIER